MDSWKITPEQVEKCIDFHGHWCPGLAIGIRAAEIALRELGRSSDEEIVAVAETDFCGVDAIQVLTGCTMGKGNLLVRNLGKVAFSFYRRSDGKCLRIVSRPDERNSGSEYRELQHKSNEGLLSEEEEGHFQDLRNQRCRLILHADLDSLFDVKEVQQPLPDFAPMGRSVICDECGEKVMETKARLSGGRILCRPCFERENPRI